MVILGILTVPLLPTYYSSTLRYRLRPRMLRDVSHLDTSTTILGERISFPVGVSPTAVQCMAHYEGEAGTARGLSYYLICSVLILVSYFSLLWCWYLYDTQHLVYY